ncbi:bifunctional diguanylate cyclase/phosphodiesterase [Paenibacillus sp. TRM 82003]|uniref:putative bifunctional diguanylate cyclase/phosphodiesterase n=1 Tax=Kineococcus sp. TRM81007 TaxID=2925831 RepID=UPI001F572736|nr:bifunctional diguanylate cyclase/phosphodiesterase [Kineococcus sp. TRM81007]MCI2239635.1 bifunctional diguanylate cyclase/phosphodiesterase [Kineococcus sp. TRM81007]MCI3926083.1 bifunctional diguanylate cyclase/phosphodiesterase [Paenibacillus sp. TRM 82003]
MTAAAPATPRARAAVAAALLLPLLALLPLAHARWDAADRLTTAVGLVALLGAALPLVVRWALGRLQALAYGVAGTVWGAGVTVAGLWPHATVGPAGLPRLALTAAVLGMLGLAVQHVLAARSGTDDPPLLVDALMLGSALAVAGWEVLSRTTPPGGTPWPTTVPCLLLVSAHVGMAAALAVEHARMRLTCIAAATMTAATATAALTPHQGLAHGAIVVALVAGSTAALVAPTAAPRHAGVAAARAARRMEIATLVPGPVLFVDIAVLVAFPRLDPVLFALYLWVLATFTARHVVTARAVDRSTARLTSQALHDDLTGLGNRAALQHALTGPDHDQCLVLLELTGLDDVNDVLGVSTGDALIRAAAHEVHRAAAPWGATAHRTGGDEIAVLVPGDAERAVRLAHALVDAVAEAPAQVDGAARFPVSAVAGIAPCPARPTPRHPGGGTGQQSGEGAGDPMTALLRADVALRDARLAGRGHVSVYSGDVAAAHARRTLLRERLTAALRDGDLDVHYQPIVSFRTGRVEKFEALARWDDPVLGRIHPGEFIAVAEESNLVVALGEHVLRTAVRGAHSAGAFAAGAGLTVNVSVVQLQAPGFADTVRDVLTRHGVPPHLLTLELTESVFLDTDSPAERVVTELAGLGCTVAIDDFGTGYSAFGYLDRLPVHVLKIDRSLTSSITEAGNGRSVVTCVVDLATRLGMAVVVEGVETERQAAACREMNAPLGQGWLYSAAVPLDAVPAQLARTYPVPGLAVPSA